MNKTALQWLYDELAQCLHREEVCDLVYKLEQKAKEMEREQILDAYGNIELDDNGNTLNSYQYYEQNYGDKDE
jgi:hypothetical protein